MEYNNTDDELYKSFVEEVNRKELSMKEIMEKLELTPAKKKELHYRAKKEGKVPAGRYCRKQVKNYFYNRYHKMWCVRKVVNHFDTYFGEYPTEEMAKRVTELLHECNWNKEELPRIQMKVWREFDV
jgi:hypothetical protein